MPAARMFVQRRRRTESVRSNTSTDELTSCFDDDVCTTCGSAVHAGQLYCSQQCREEDALSGADASMASTSAPAQSHRRHSAKPPMRNSSGEGLAGAAALAAAATADRHRQMYVSKTQESTADGKFRYVCPPSPSILAKQGGHVAAMTTATTATSHLTSPALAALDQRTPLQQRHAGSNGAKGPRSSSEMSSSSEDSNTQANQSSGPRRSSSRSTFSSASDATVSTDQGTPSPARRATLQDDLDDLDVLADFNLPPSVHPAATVMLNASAASHRSPVHKTVPLPGAGQPAPRRDGMSYARRPSKTNLPAPVMFTSPVLHTTKTTDKKKAPRGSFGEHDRSNHGTRYDVPTLATLRKFVEGVSPLESPPQQRSSVSAMPVVNGGGSDRTRTSLPSPPQVASASSSAGKTMRAFSPATMTSATSPATVGATLVNIPSTTHHSPTPEVGFVCGRYGCHGLSGGSSESAKTMAPPMQTAQGGKSRRLSSLFAHKHTHSAAAGLSLLGGVGKEERGDGHAAAKKLAMTPLIKAEATSAKEADVGSDVSDTLSRLVKSPPRGRSHARGRSSTSRRSPSPPRGVARRGRSEDMLSSKGGAYVSPRSQPIAVSRVSPHEDAEADAVHDADDEKDHRETGRRGRSPTERGRATTRVSQPAKAIVPAVAQSNKPTVVGLSTKVNSSGYDEVDLDEL